MKMDHVHLKEFDAMSSPVKKDKILLAKGFYYDVF